MSCKTITNAEVGALDAPGVFTGIMFSASSITPMLESAAKLKATWVALLQKDINDGRVMLIKRTEQQEIGEPEVLSAPSVYGDIPYDYTEATHTLTKYVSDCGKRSLLKSLGRGVEVEGFFISKGNFICGKQDTDGNFAPIKMFIHAVGMEATSDNGFGKVMLTISIRDDFYQENQWFIKPDFDVDELEGIKEVYLNDITASDTADTVVFTPKTCGGCIISDVTLSNYTFTADGTTITPTGITQANGVVTAEFAAAEVTGAIVIGLVAPSTSGENYEITISNSTTAV
jgi:hypothetical protein